jgi:hypothetical protein
VTTEIQSAVWQGIFCGWEARSEKPGDVFPRPEKSFPGPPDLSTFSGLQRALAFASIPLFRKMSL